MNFIDKLITVFNPEKGLKRFQARRKLEILNTGYSNYIYITTPEGKQGYISLLNLKNINGKNKNKSEVRYESWDFRNRILCA